MSFVVTLSFALLGTLTVGSFFASSQDLVTLHSQDSVTDYAPNTNVECPDFSTTSLIRDFTPENQTLHPREIDYVDQRARLVLPEAWQAWLGANEAGHGYNLSVFQDNYPRVGMAIPGGGLRAALYGAGCLNGLDARNGSAKAAGTGGLLQDPVNFLPGFLSDTSLTDPWARMISFHFLNQTNRANFFTNDTAHGAGQLWSNIPLIPAYQQYQTPFPIIVSDSRPVGSNLTTALSPDSTVFEITPLELASYDPNLSAGMNLTYAGTHLSNGKAVNGSACVTGFDQAGFIMGSSASLFNQLLDFARNKISDFSGSDGAAILYVLSRQLQEVRTRADDVANWPSPFTGLKNTTFQDSDKDWLELIDGSSNQENVPYGPLFVRARGLDVIVTIEGSASDSNNWPNGTGPIMTSQRQSTILRSSHQQFPPIPQNAQAFIETGVNARPTFFGCDPKQIPPEFPLVIYLPNSPPINGDDPVTNYTRKHQELFLSQAHTNTISGFSPNANNPDPNYGTCLQCAAIDRGRLKMAQPIGRSPMCQKCFLQYCYDPENPPSRAELPGRKQLFVDPDPQGVGKLGNFFVRNRFALIGGLAGLVALLALLVGGL
ncbi:hypothetical protein H0H93_008299 [Arthromyces matolae]|nr:hypothetical protein H0H93_008299 [Arthromyces matolae]